VELQEISLLKFSSVCLIWRI